MVRVVLYDTIHDSSAVADVARMLQYKNGWSFSARQTGNG